MTVEDYVSEIVPYFNPRYYDDASDLLTPLEPDEYSKLLSLIERAIGDFPEEPCFWFWRGWALQFFGGNYASLPRHPNFELIEDSYEQVLRLGDKSCTNEFASSGAECHSEEKVQEHREAFFMLAYLYWDTIRRGEVAEHGDQSSTDVVKVDLETVSIEVARQLWKSFYDSGGLMDPGGLMAYFVGEYFYFYPFSPPVWSILLERMLPDLVDESTLSSVYFLWGYARLRDFWLDRKENQDIENSKAKTQYVYEQARRAFAAGAKIEDPINYSHLACQAFLARYHSELFFGDPNQGLREYAQLASMVDIGRQKGYRYLKYMREGIQYAIADDTEEFFYENPRLVDNPETVAVLEQLKNVGWLQPIAPEGSWRDAKLAWYYGRVHFHQRNWTEAEQYLREAYEEMELEPELIQQLAFVLDELGKTEESERLLRTLPGQTVDQLLLRRQAERAVERTALVRNIERLPASLDRIEGKIDTVYGLVNNLGEGLTTAIQQFRMPEVSPNDRSRLDTDEIVSRIAFEVGNHFQTVIAGQKTLLSNVRRKCQIDLHGIWSTLSPELQEQVVMCETMNVLFTEYSVPGYGALIIQWGKVAELLLNTGFLLPFAHYLDTINHSSSILVDLPEKGDKFRTDQIDFPGNVTSWTARLKNIPYSKSLGLLFAAQRRPAKHVVNDFLQSLGAKSAELDAWLTQVPEHLNLIREYRNNAAHNSNQYYLTDALEVRSVLYSRGLLSQMAWLIKHTSPRGA